MAHAGGRPTKYDKVKTLAALDAYLENCKMRFEEEFVYAPDGTVAKFKTSGDEKTKTFLRVNLPSMAGFAVFYGVNKDTLQEWAKQHVEFSVRLKDIKDLQEDVLIEGSASGKIPDRIGKLLLHGHGYSDKTEITGAEGQPIVIAISEHVASKHEAASPSAS